MSQRGGSSQRGGQGGGGGRGDRGGRGYAPRGGSNVNIRPHENMIHALSRMSINGNNAPDGTPLYMPAATQVSHPHKAASGNGVDPRPQNKQALAKLSPAFEGDFPFRKQFADTNSTVFSNHFTLTLNPNMPLYEYNITNFPEGMGTTRARLAVRVMLEHDEYLVQQQDNFATDYLTRIISWVKLDDTKLSTIKVHLNDRSEGVLALQIVYLGIIDSNALLNHAIANSAPKCPIHEDEVMDDGKRKEGGELGPIINAFNILISKAVSRDSVSLKSNKLFVMGGHKPLGQSSNASLCTMRGYFYTIKAGMGHILLNLNACTSAFFSPMLVSEFLNDNDTFRYKGDRLDALRGLRVYITHSRGEKLDETQARIKTIGGTGKSAATQTFKLRKQGTTEYRTVTVQQYLQETYQVTLKTPQMPAINVSTRDKAVWLAPEHLHILPYQLYKRPVPDHLTRFILDEACKHPQASRAMIELEGLKQLGVTSSQGLVKFTKCPVLQIDPCMVQIPSARLQYPRIVYKQPLSLSFPSWNLRDQKFLLCNSRAQFKVYAIVDVRLQGRDTTDIYLREFYNLAQKRYTIGQYQHLGTERLDNPAALTGAMANANTKGANFVLLILKEKSIATYSTFKDVADRKYGFHALCVTEKPNYKGGQVQNIAGYFGNVMMKANLKAGGTNHSVEGIADIMNDTLVLGADVTHPGPGALLGTPSIAAIVGSVDKTGGKFLGSMRLQPKDAVEVIQASNVESMVLERLSDWRKANASVWPKNILYYRDGVSEGQYSQVKAIELPSIHAAVAALAKKSGLKSVPAVKLTAMIVAKRHHVRFYPKEGEGARGNGNCQPGTLVDSTVTSPFYQDFYLQSHNGLKGTAKPAHYFVLVNGMGLAEKVLQNFTHKICYTYVRATLGVSYAAPAYYADRLCERGRCYLRKFFVAEPNLRTELDNFKFQLQRDFQAKRDAEFRPNQSGCGKGKGREEKKTREEEKRENEHKKAVEEMLKRDTLGKARREFYGESGSGGNPWSDKLAGTMFWM
ncbi:Piwi-domain-containing protein [Byssothecium circinans]|uniref:Piwi-domain-containing protein n=1 Tax=Byssothecium circinans TaxID=147558 RepID=A0A6A5TG74_9PLEO|nr:Piwi-domain-containing protein [Byssothecium circinans]